MNKDIKIKLHDGLKESIFGFLFAIAYVILKFIYQPDLLDWFADIVFVFSFIAFCFIRGYKRGSSITNFYQEMKKKREEILNERFSEDLKCYKCSSIIKPNDKSCPSCGWTWEL